jgi:hypothetical protein
VAALRELAERVPPAAILWRYDPVFVSARYGPRHHRDTFGRLLEELAGRVDRVAVSFVTRYKRQVEPDLRSYQAASGDAVEAQPLAEQVELASELAELAEAAGVPLTVCCSPELRAALGRPRSGCNAFDWARRVYPELERHPRLRNRPSRDDCACSAEWDIGVYDTCVLGCRYSYGSCSEPQARRRFALHDPDAPCLLP